jgi:NB-ARC domain
VGFLSVQSKYLFGLNLGDAPGVDESYFVGREVELNEMKNNLLPGDSEQKIQILFGSGGIGKTQLAIQFAKRYRLAYSAIFWLNASNKEALQRDLISMASRVLEPDANVAREMSGAREEAEQIDQVRQWLSKTGNGRWLLIFDGYDHPQFSGERDANAYEARHFFPYTAQGSIVITTRSPRLSFGKSLRLQKLEDVQQSSAILTRRSGRSDVERGKTFLLG